MKAEGGRVRQEGDQQEDRQGREMWEEDQQKTNYLLKSDNEIHHAIY